VDEYVRLSAQVLTDARAVRAAVNAVAHPGKLRHQAPVEVQEALAPLHRYAMAGEWSALRPALEPLLAQTPADRAESRPLLEALSDLSALQELNRLLSERAASAEQRAEAAITRAARLQRSYDADVPQGQTRELLDLVQQRLKDGVPAARLEFLLREARVERKCDPPSETKRLLVHTSVTPTPAATAGFAKNQITLTVEGAPQRKPDGRTDPIFDPQQPVTLHLLRIGRDVAKAEGRLPLSHSVVLGDREFRFTAKAVDKPAGQVELIAQVCDFP